MDLPLDRWCNAIMAWLRRTNTGTEEGNLRWAEVERYVATPLTTATPAGPTPRPARMSAEQEAAAFAAFESFG